MKRFLSYAYPYPNDYSTAAGQMGWWNRRVQRILAVVVVATLSFLAMFSLTTKYYYRQPPPDPNVRELLRDDGATRPEYFQWDTISAFNPASQDISSASNEQLCRSFPNHLLESMVQPVLKMGHSENRAKIESQIASVSACINDPIIFSDMDETIHGRSVIDILVDVPAAYHFKNDDLANYTYIRNLRTSPDAAEIEGDAKRTIDGWLLDRYKFLPMIERVWTMRPNRKWYFFYETDTYVFWDNLFRFLDNLDHETPFYIGSASPGRREDAANPETTNWFANGGPGFALSRAAMLKLLKRGVGQDGDYLEPPLCRRWLELQRQDPCGDSILGWAFRDVGVRLAGFWPMVNPHPLHGVPFSHLYWCQPVLTLHKTNPEEMEKLWRWEQSRRQNDRPLLYRDLFDFHHGDRPPYREDWDNGEWDSYAGPNVKLAAECGKACDKNGDCFQWRWHMDSCMFMRSIRYGQHREPDAPPTDADGDDVEKKKKVEWTYEQRRYISGWSKPKIDRWYSEQTCEEVQWVRPSLTRIF